MKIDFCKRCCNSINRIVVRKLDNKKIRITIIGNNNNCTFYANKRIQKDFEINYFDNGNFYATKMTKDCFFYDFYPALSNERGLNKFFRDISCSHCKYKFENEVARGN
jgi:hypothetical protein